MSEIKLQSDIAREFSVRYPKKKGQLFHAANERNNKIQAFQAKAIGIIPGVSDFLYFELFHPRENGTASSKILGIEVKEPGSYHKVEHVRKQVEWGVKLRNNGGDWIIATNVNSAMEFISKSNVIEGALTIEDVLEMLDKCVTKTIKF